MFNCGKPGHMFKNCLQRQNQKQGKDISQQAESSVAQVALPKSQIICYGCGKEGHKEIHCWEKKSVPQGSTDTVTCSQCGQVGHEKLQCQIQRPIIQDSSDLPICYHCRQPGHVRRSCPQLRFQKQLAGSSATGSIVAPVTAQQSRLPTFSAPLTYVSQVYGVGSVAPRGGGQQGQGIQQSGVYVVTTSVMRPDFASTGGTFIAILL